MSRGRSLLTLVGAILCTAPVADAFIPTPQRWRSSLTASQCHRTPIVMSTTSRSGEENQAGKGGMDRRDLLKTVATGLGMASLLGGVQAGRVEAIGSLPETESSKRFAQHLVMNVPDIDEAVKFYTVALGMKVLRSRVVNGVNSTFVGYGPETLTQPKTFYPGVSSFNEYGAHFAIELNEAPRTKSGDVPILDPGTGVQYLQIAIPSVRVSKIREGEGSIEYAYGWLRVRSPWGILHQIIVGERRDPMMYLAIRVKDQASSQAFYKDVLGMSEQPYPLSRLPGSQFEPPQPPGSKYLSYDPDGFGILLLPSEKNEGPIEQGAIYDKIAILDTDVLDKAQSLGSVKFAGKAPGIGTRVAVTSDPDGYGVVLVEYDDFEKEVVP